MMSSPLLRVVVVNSQAQTRAVIRETLAAVPSVAVVGEYHDVMEATQTMSGSRPDVVILEVPSAGAETATPTLGLETLVRRLPDSAIVATSSNGAAEFVLQVLRAGAMEFVREPIEPTELAAALDKLTRLRGRHVQRQPGRVFAVFSAKGGLGATTLAVNVGVCCAGFATTKRSLLLELDTRQSDIMTFLDLHPRYSILDVFESMDRIDESLLQGLMVKHTSGLWVLPGPSRMERAHLDGDQVHAGIAMLREHFDHVVLDLRHDVDPATVAALEAADTILFVTSLNVSALRSGAAALAAFRHLGLDLKKIKVVVMRDGTGEDVTVKHARETLGLPVYWKTPSEYGPVVASINNGRPVVTDAPRSKFARSVRELAELLINGRAVGPSAAHRPVSRLAAAWPIKHLSRA